MCDRVLSEDMQAIGNLKDQQATNFTSMGKALVIADNQHSVKNNCLMLEADSRTSLPNVPASSVSCIITSPPYGNLKDYGSAGQIGYGQDIKDEYLPDLEKILAELSRVAKSGAALWMILDTMKDAGEAVPLPWEVITRARQAGWNFQDLVIWDKGKSLPWSNKGKFRGVCEYILLFAKGNLTNFDINSVRDAEHLSSYWVKYPERYHPDGKAPSDLWHFPIPVQGSWSKGQSRHHCPFPVGLVARMLLLTTNPGDIVLDPFAGTGSVIAVASHLGRYGIGIELNPNYVQEFDNNGFDALEKQSRIELPQRHSAGSSLRQTIIELRMLKYAKSLFSVISRSDRLSSAARASVGAFVLKSACRSQESFGEELDSGNLGRIELQVLLREGADESAVKDTIQQRMVVPPLSIFGIKADVEVLPFISWNDKAFFQTANDEPWYVYRNGRFHNYDNQIYGWGLLDIVRAEAGEPRFKTPSILSKIGLTLEKPAND